MLAHVQKIYSTHHFLCLCLRFPGHSVYLYLGRGGGHEGIFVGHRPPPSVLRVRDRYLEYWRKYLVGAYLHPLQLADGDRVLHFHYSRAEEHGLLSLFIKGRQLYFAHAKPLPQGQYQLFLSWAKQARDAEAYPWEKVEEMIDGHFAQLGAYRQFEPIEQLSFPASNAIDPYFESLKSGKQVLKQKHRKFLLRKIANIESDLDRIKSWSELKRLIEAPGFYFADDYRQTLLGHKFTFTQEQNHFQKMGKVYDKIKSLKRGEQILQARLSEARAELLARESMQTVDEYRLPDKITCPVWKTEESSMASVVEPQGQVQIVEFHWRGLRFAVGTSAHGNDYLRTKWAKDDDLWFHLEGHQSAHLVVRQSDLQNIREETLGIIASILCDYSKLTLNPIPLIYTQIKNLKGIKGKAGSVIYKKIKHLSLSYHPQWKEIISTD